MTLDDSQSRKDSPNIKNPQKDIYVNRVNYVVSPGVSDMQSDVNNILNDTMDLNGKLISHTNSFYKQKQRSWF